MSTSSDEEFFDCAEPKKYFAVSCPKNKEKGLVTTDINEAKKKIKSVKGSRFAVFYDSVDAEKYCKSILAEDNELTKDKSKSYTECFSDVPPNILNIFKDAIEKGDVEKCKQIIVNNPRNLVTQSNFPSLLRASSFHYNALHVAIASNRPDIVKFILENISQDEFWSRIYPTADGISNQETKIRVKDMFLNNPENKNFETPLHIASKFGFTECLRLLLNEELTDRAIKNSQRLRADDIICNRYDKPDKEVKYSEIKEMFSEKYVVLIEGFQDKMEILQPLHHCQLLKMLRAGNDLYRVNNRNVSMTDCENSLDYTTGTVRAYIGPLPEIKARQLRGRWTVLNAEDAIKFELIRRKDAEKGFECHGRYLAQLFGAPWKEFWSFLNCYTDLSSEDGLNKLESYLEDVKITQISINEVSVIEERSKYHDVYSSLVNLFSRLTLYSFLKHTPLSSPVKINMCKFESPMIDSDNFTTSTPMRHPTVTRLQNNCASTNRSVLETKAATKTDRWLNKTEFSINQGTSLRSIRMPFNISILGQGVLTPTDRQVRRAVLSSSQGKYLNFPNVSSWIDELSLVDPIETDIKSMFITSTPLKQRKTVEHTLPNFISPLSHIELTDE